MSLKRSVRLGLAMLGVLAATACTAIIGVDGLPDPTSVEGGVDSGAPDATGAVDAGPGDATAVTEEAGDSSDASDADLAPDAPLNTCTPGLLEPSDYSAKTAQVRFDPVDALRLDDAGALFGAAVAITPELDGGLLWLAVGAPRAGSAQQGAVQVIKITYSDTSNSLYGSYLLQTNVLAGDALGSALAFSPDGRYLALGAPGVDDADAATGGGAVDLFAYTGQCWAYVRRITSPVGAPPRFGTSVALTAGANDAGAAAELLIGAPGFNGAVDHGPAGVVYLYDLIQPTGTVDPRLAMVNAHTTATMGELGDALGFSLAASSDGSEILIGAPGALGGVGAVYGTTLAQLFGSLALTELDPESDPDAQLGYSVAITNDGRYGLAGVPGNGYADFITGSAGDGSLMAARHATYSAGFGESVAVTPTMIYSGYPGGGGSGGTVAEAPILAGTSPTVGGNSPIAIGGGVGTSSAFGTALAADDQQFVVASIPWLDNPAQAQVYLFH